MASFGEDLGFNRYSLGDLYGGIKRQAGLKDYSRPDDSAAIIAALLARNQQGLGQINPMMARAPQVPASQVPVMPPSQGRSGYSVSGAPSGNGGGMSLEQIKDVYDKSKDIYDKFKGSPESVTSGMGAPPGSGVAQPIDLASIGSSGLGSIGAGTMFGTSGSAALGAAAPVSGGAALSNLGTIGAGEMFGTSGSLAAGAGPGSLGTAGGVGGLGVGTGASGAAGGAGAAGTTAGSIGILPGLGLGAWISGPALGDAINDALGFNKNSDAINAWRQGTGMGGNIGGRTPMFVLPTGEVVRADDRMAAAARAYVSGDQAAYKQAYADMVANAPTFQSTDVFGPGFELVNGKAVATDPSAHLAKKPPPPKKRTRVEP